MIDRRAFLSAAVMTLAACSKSAPEKHYKLTGEVLTLDPKGQQATIKGDKIEGWMEAMTMEYPIKDPSELAKLAPGDRIQATVIVGESNYRLTDIKVTGKAR
jgi:Cu/Ag efflux protein CusF